MAQVLKEEVRARILEAALEVFATRGFPGATMSAIAERAGVATANVYRYYPGKQELFDAVVTPELAEAHEQHLERSVRSLSFIARGGPPQGEARGAEELLRFWIAHRLAVVILLERGEGTAYAHHGERFVEQLVKLTLAELREAHPGLRVPAAAKLVLEQVFEGTRRAIAAVLRESASEAAVRQGIEAFRAYQIPGLRGLTEWIVAGEGRSPG